MNRPTSRTALLAALVTAVAASTAQAHVVFTRTDGAPGAYFTAALRVSHACGDSPTRTLQVTIPAGIISAKPQPKAGWTIAIEREPLAVPVAGESGALITQRIKTITWRGNLPADQFDEFGLSLTLPKAASGPLYFPAVQSCAAGENRWTDIPAAGAAWGSVAHPAPVINMPTPPAPTHDMSSMPAMPGMDHSAH